jgi:uncharacterized FAD-dependent dehydrogenase
MIRISKIRVPIELDSEDYLVKKVSKKLDIKKELIKKVIIHKKSLDARDKKNILYVYELDVNVPNERKYLCSDVIIKPDETYRFNITGNEKLNNRVVVVGSGPAGLFSAYVLAENGYKPLIIERGEDVDKRLKSVENFWQTGVLNPNSNVQFGCGGAGTFSDGKLNTLVKEENNRHRKVFEVFIKNGASPDILYNFNPHIGTDKLREIIKNICNEIENMGGEFLFNTNLTNIILKDNKVTGIEVNNKNIIKTETLILAIGHSSRDTFKLLQGLNVNMESKPFAIGLRVQHNQEMINKNEYGDKCNLLPPASYKLTYKAGNGRGVYSFCMCPGGYVVNASSEQGKLAINGMSNFARESENANSAIVVTLTKEDFNNDPFSGLEFQEELEQKAYELGNGTIPITLYKDFKQNKVSNSFGKINPIFKGNYTFANLNLLLPKYITKSIIEGMEYFNHRIPGFNDDDVILSGIESRTSSPIRIIRDDSGLSNIKGLYPCGEGAGYAGGITSAAIDGIKQAENIAKKYKSFKEE